MSSKNVSLRWLASGLIVVAACGSGGGETVAPRTPASVAAVAGASTQAPAGTALPVAPSVRVLDASGNGLSGVTVTFTVTGGGGTVLPATAASDASGIATVTKWTLGPTPGPNTMTATVGSLPAVTFNATGTGGGASQLQKTSTDPQSATVGTAVASKPSVTLKDASGNPVAGVTVTFAVASGGGSLTGASAVTSASGVATVGSWTLGTTSGANTLTASATGASPVTFTATGVAGAPAQMTVTPASTAMGVGEAQQVTAAIADQYGNQVTNPQVSYASSSSGVASVSTSGQVSGVAFGTATITVTAGALSTQIPVKVATHPGASRLDVAESGRPYAARISSQNALLVGELDNARLGRYALPSTTLAGTISVGSVPTDIDFSQNGQTAYVVNQASGTLGFVNMTTHTQTSTVPIVGSPQRVLASSDGIYVYVTTAGGEVIRVNATTMARDSIAPTGTLTGIAAHPTKPLLYVSASEGAVYEIDFPTGHVLRAIQTGGHPQDIAISPDGTTLYVADLAGALQVRALSSGAIVSNVAAASGGFDVEITPDGAQLYVTQSAAGKTVVLDRGTLSVVRTFTGTTPRRIAFDTFGTTAAVADEGNVVTIVK